MVTFWIFPVKCFKCVSTLSVVTTFFSTLNKFLVFLAISKDLIKAFDFCDRYGTALALSPLVGRFTGSRQCEDVGSRKPSVSRLVMIEAAGLAWFTSSSSSM